MAVQSKQKKLPKNMSSRREKLVFKSVLNFRKVTYFSCACLKRKWLQYLQKNIQCFLVLQCYCFTVGMCLTHVLHHVLVGSQTGITDPTLTITANYQYSPLLVLHWHFPTYHY